MKNKPIERSNSKLDTVVILEQKNRKLQIQIDRLQNQILGFQNKTLKFENKTLKQEQKIIKLEVENAKLREIPDRLEIKLVKPKEINEESGDDTG